MNSNGELKIIVPTRCLSFGCKNNRVEMQKQCQKCLQHVKASVKPKKKKTTRDVLYKQLEETNKQLSLQNKALRKRLDEMEANMRKADNPYLHG